MSATIEIRLSDSDCLNFTLPDTGSVLGSGAESGIRLESVVGLAARHVLLMPRKRGVWLAINREVGGHFTYHGEQLRSGLVPWGEQCEVGALRVRVLQAAATSKGRPDVRAVLGVVMAAAGAYVLFGASTGDSLARAGEFRPPVLFSIVDECSKDVGAAAGHARFLERVGDAKAERYPFEPTDGVESVGLLSEAEACYRAAGQESDRARAASKRAVISARVEEDYRTQRLLMERALTEKDYIAAFGAAQALERLTAKADGPYVEWLHRVTQQLGTAIEKAQSEAKQ